MPEKLKWIYAISDLLDSKFRIPGTNIRFGLDFIIGLIPYGGDIFSFVLSSLLILIMVFYGASGIVVVKMIGNVLLDTIVGTIPILGDIFDLRYRANMKNIYLLREHYEKGKHKGSAWPVILMLFLLFVVLFVFLFYWLWKLTAVILTWVIS